MNIRCTATGRASRLAAYSRAETVIVAAIRGPSDTSAHWRATVREGPFNQLNICSEFFTTCIILQAMSKFQECSGVGFETGREELHENT
jgi:hypothetical protein